MTLKNVAAQAGVSVTTACDILNRGRGENYDARTCARVMDIARRGAYRPSRLGRVMRSARTGVIGFVTAQPGEGEYAAEDTRHYTFIMGMSHYLLPRQGHVALVDLTELIRRDASAPLPGNLYERFYDGVVLYQGIGEEVAKGIRQTRSPILWWDSGVFAETDCLYRDERAIGRELTRRLIELKHRRIAYMAGRWRWHAYTHNLPLHFSHGHRFEGYRDELRRQDLEEIVLLGYDPPALAAQLKEQQVTAVIGHWSDALAMAAASLGWRIPDDLSVASLDCEPRARAYGVVHGGMTYDRYAAGRRAADMITGMIETGRPAPSVTVTGEFRMGDTIAPARV